MVVFLHTSLLTASLFFIFQPDHYSLVIIFIEFMDAVKALYKALYMLPPQTVCV